MSVHNEPNIYPYIADDHAAIVMRLAAIIPPLTGMADVCVEYRIKDNQRELIDTDTTFSVDSDCPGACMGFGFHVEWGPGMEPHADAELQWNADRPDLNELHCIKHTLEPGGDGLVRRTLFRAFSPLRDENEPLRTKEKIYPATAKSVVTLARYAASITRAQATLKNGIKL